jgi:predicted Zn finger-like uncharacterized protein
LRGREDPLALPAASLLPWKRAGKLVKFLCEQCKAKYQIADDKAAGKTVRMKCRKCGHLIEVRATATDSAPPPSARPAQASSGKPAPPRAPQRPAPAPPRAGALASGMGASRPASPQKPPERSGALAGAFKTAVQREEESSAPFDMDDLSPSDEWYVAINGVPVGPIRIAEVRRKAALGAVTEDSLCWQEGLDEWRPVRAFPELAAIVREAAASGRSSLPPSEGRSSSMPGAAAHRPSRPPQAPAGATPRPPARPAPAAARSNVVPITSRLATAERLDEDDLEGATKMQPGLAHDAGVVADPFANPPAPAPAPAAMTAQLAPVVATGQHMTAEPSVAALAPRKSPPWMAIAMVAAAIAFGVTAALALVLRPAAPPPAPVVVQMPGVPAPPTATTTAPAPTATATDTTNPEVPGAASGGKGPIAMGGPPKPGASAPPGAATATAKGPLDLGGLGGSGPRPGEDPGGDAPKAPGQCFSSAQVSQVIGLHQPGIRRSCWERNPTTKPTVNVNVSLTIGADGSPGNVNASADELTVAKCVENDVRTWHFPAMGCSQATSFSFHFVRQ